MTGLSVLFIGGSGVISSACSQVAVDQGLHLSVLNRGASAAHRPLPDSASVLRGDARDPDSVRQAIGSQEFDVVVDWVAFTPEHVRADIEIFRGRVGQYVFISSASAYQNKIACEDELVSAYRADGFPVTIVRPSHTYDKTSVPFTGGWTVLGRMRQGKPIVVHGDGTSLWTLTHHQDFARGFVPLLGHQRAIGEAFHITSDDVLTWNQIALMLAAAAGTCAEIVHVPSDTIAAMDPDWGASLLGDKSHSMVFDNAKLRTLVPGCQPAISFEQGAREIVGWHDEDPARQQRDPRIDAAMDKLIAVGRPRSAGAVPRA